jgi:predicted kinase
MTAPLLIAMAGLPGTGKSTLACGLAERLRGVWLRIDTIEQAIRDAGLCAGDVGPAGYIVGYGIAATNLRLGHVVVADSVNPIAITRDAWRDVARRAGAGLAEVETICSDPVEHRHRVETRSIDVAGLVPPTWAEVVGRERDPWTRPRIVIDTAGRSIDACLDEVLAAIARGASAS